MVMFFAVAKHVPSVVMHAPKGVALGPGAFLAAALTASYVLYGFETAGSLAEETVSPRTASPRAILLAVGSAGVVGALLILSALMAAHDPFDPALGRSDGGLAKIATDALGTGVGRRALWLFNDGIERCEASFTLKLPKGFRVDS